MSDFMEWLYNNAIEAYIKTQRPDDREAHAISLFEDEFNATQKEDLEDIFAFYAVHGFRLGVRIGLALADDLR